jgi:hypothetical protein
MAAHDYDAVAHAVEQACVAFQGATDPGERAAAERVILDFRRADGAVALGLAVLARTRLATAQFHALGALRDGVLREWGGLGAEARAALEVAVLGLLGVAHADHAVQAKAAELLALVAKLDALDALGDGGSGGGGGGGGGTGQACGRLLAHASALFGLHEPQRLAALLLLSALVHEFGAPAHGGGGVGAPLPAELQRAARRDFEAAQLPRLFDALVELLLGGLADPAAPPAAPVLARSVALLGVVLGWDFAGTTGAVGGAPADDGGGGGSGGARAGLIAATVRPPAEWRGRVDNPALLAAGWELYRRLRAAAADCAAGAGADAGCAAALEASLHGCRQLLIQLASVHASAFGSADAHAAFVTQTARALVSLCAAPLAPSARAVGADGAAAEALDVAALAQRLVANSGAAALAALAQPDARALYDGLLAAACAASAALEAAASAAAAGDAAAAEAADEGLRAVADGHAELWVSLLEAHAPVGPAEPHPLAAHARALFGAAVRAALALAAADGAADGECDDALEEALEQTVRAERLDALCALGRADGAHSATVLAAALAERTAALRAACAALADGGSGGGPSASQARALGGLLEQLDTLVRLCARTLADAAAGEAPAVPRALAAATCAAAAVHPAARCVGALVELLALQDELVLASAARGHAADAAARAEAEAWRARGGASGGGGGGGGCGGGGLASACARMCGGAFEAVLSPRLAEALLWALERLAPTYLLQPPDAAACAPVALWAEGSAGGRALLGACVDGAALRLLCWAGEPALAMQACRLLRTLARAPAAAAELRAQPGWARVLCAAAPGSRVLWHASPKAQRVLTEALACAAGAAPTAGAVSEGLAQLCAALGARLDTLAAADGAVGSQLEAAALAQAARGLCRAVGRLARADADGGEAAERLALRAQLLGYCATLAAQLGPPLLPRFAAAEGVTTGLLRVQADCARAAAHEGARARPVLRALCHLAQQTAVLLATRPPRTLEADEVQVRARDRAAQRPLVSFPSFRAAPTARDARPPLTACDTARRVSPVRRARAPRAFRPRRALRSSSRSCARSRTWPPRSPTRSRTRPTAARRRRPTTARRRWRRRRRSARCCRRWTRRRSPRPSSPASFTRPSPPSSRSRARRARHRSRRRSRSRRARRCASARAAARRRSRASRSRRSRRSRPTPPPTAPPPLARRASWSAPRRPSCSQTWWRREYTPTRSSRRRATRCSR